jgi:hypothetical protein
VTPHESSDQERLDDLSNIVPGEPSAAAQRTAARENTVSDALCGSAGADWFFAHLEEMTEEDEFEPPSAPS